MNKFLEFNCRFLGWFGRLINAIVLWVDELINPLT